MAAFFDYIRNITYYLLFATLIGMAAPSGKYKKYVSLVTGLVLVLLMIKPLQSLAGAGLPVTDLFANAEAVPAEMNLNFNQINDAFEGRLYAQVETLLAQEGYVLRHAEFEYAEDFSALTSICLAAEAAPEAAKINRPFIRIEPVNLEERAAENADAEKIKKLLTDFYAPNAVHIDVETR